jgi:tryptophan synthase alpha subunit
MANETDTDIAVLQTDIKQLRADFAKIAGTMRDIASNGVAGAGEQVQASAQKAWSDVKRQAHNVGREIEERPIAAALGAFATGVILGLFLTGRRS